MRKVVGTGLSRNGIEVFHSKQGSSKKILPINKEGLIFYMPVDCNFMNMVFDCSGKNNHGTRYGAFVTNNGKVGKGLQFDGVDDYVDCGNKDSLNITDEITVVAWIYPTALNTNQSYVCNRYYHTPFALAAHYNEFEWVYMLTNGNYEYLRCGLNWVTNKWQFIAVTHKYSTGEIHFYLDDVKTDKTALYTGTPTQQGKVAIGAISEWAGFYGRHFKGTIDEIKIYNRVLTVEEILSHYQKEV